MGEEYAPEMKPLRERFTPAFAVSVLALLVALGGTGYAASKITSRDIKNGTIKSVDISAAAKQALQTQHASYIFNTSAESVAVEAAVVFDSNGPLDGVSHTTGTSAVTVTEAGTYEIDSSVSAVEPNQFALFLNGLAIPGSDYGSGAGTQQNNGRVIATLAAGDILTLVNHSSASAVTLQTVAGGTATNVNASLLVRKLA